MHYKKKNKFNNKICDNKMTFEECELAILRHSMEENTKAIGQKIIESPEIQKIVLIVEDFIVHKKLICYGGTAINNILPKYARFYKKETELPDYDFYSDNALDDAKELADIYYAAGYKDVEAKAGVHMGTFKVFVNFIAIADITYIHKELYDSLQKESIIIAGVHYAPPDFLRMSMYLELSRPEGDITRWEKVLKRLNLLNQHFPIKISNKCENIDFNIKINNKLKHELYLITRDNLIDQGVIFFGSYAINLYSNQINNSNNEDIQRTSNFDVIHEDPEKCAMILKEHLERNNYNKIKTTKFSEIGELISEHIEIYVDNAPLVVIFKPIACHNYNKIIMGNREINIATIDTILSFYLVFLYTNMPFYNKDKLGCMAKFLFEIQQKNRIEQRGLLKRFSMSCYGKQLTKDAIRSEKAEKYKELSNNRNSREYEMWFLKYIPDKINNKSIFSKSILNNYKKEVKIIDKKSNKEEQEQKQKEEQEDKNKNNTLLKMKNTVSEYKKRKTNKKTSSISSFMKKFRERRNNMTKKIL
jgi:hypothetical protein